MKRLIFLSLCCLPLSLPAQDLQPLRGGWESYFEQNMERPPEDDLFDFE